MTINARELSETTGLEIETVRAMARDGVLPGAQDETGVWIFPDEAEALVLSLAEASEDTLENLAEQLEEEALEAELEEEEDDWDDDDDD